MIYERLSYYMIIAKTVARVVGTLVKVATKVYSRMS